MLADKASPRKIQDHMNSYLDPTIRYDIDRQLKTKPGKVKNQDIIDDTDAPAKGKTAPAAAA